MTSSKHASVQLLRDYSAIVRRLYAVCGGELATLEHFRDVGGQADGVNETILMLKLLSQSHELGLATLADEMANDLEARTGELKGFEGHLRRTMKLQVTGLIRQLEPLQKYLLETAHWTEAQQGLYPNLNEAQRAAFETLTRHTDEQFLPELAAIIPALITMKQSVSSSPKR